MRGRGCKEEPCEGDGYTLPDAAEHQQQTDQQAQRRDGELQAVPGCSRLFKVAHPGQQQEKEHGEVLGPVPAASAAGVKKRPPRTRSLAAVVADATDRSCMPASAEPAEHAEHPQPASKRIRVTEDAVRAKLRKESRAAVGADESSMWTVEIWTGTHGKHENGAPKIRTHWGVVPDASMAPLAAQWAQEVKPTVPDRSFRRWWTHQAQRLSTDSGLASFYKWRKDAATSPAPGDAMHAPLAAEDRWLPVSPKPIGGSTGGHQDRLGLLALAAAAEAEPAAPAAQPACQTAATSGPGGASLTGASLMGACLTGVSLMGASTPAGASVSVGAATPLDRASAWLSAKQAKEQAEGLVPREYQLRRVASEADMDALAPDIDIQWTSAQGNVSGEGMKWPRWIVYLRR